MHTILKATNSSFKVRSKDLRCNIKYTIHKTTKEENIAIERPTQPQDTLSLTRPHTDPQHAISVEVGINW
jgi:hypothetical protein